MRRFDFTEAVNAALRGDEDDARHIAIRNATVVAEFRKAVAELGWHFVAPGDRPPTVAADCHIVCCVVTWSRWDLDMLSDLAQSVTARQCPTYIIDMDIVYTRAELDNWLTPVPTFYTPPIIAVFVGGELSRWASRGETRSIIAML